MTALIASAVLVVTGCGSATQGSTSAGSAGSVTKGVRPSSGHTRSGGKHQASGAAVPVPGWADDLVRAGRVAYVVGWAADNSAALWRVAQEGRLSPRTPPPGMPGNPGVAPSSAVLGLVFDDPDTGLALTGTEGDRHHRGDKAVYVTDDGARTWTPVRLPAREEPIQVAIGHGAAYLLTGNCRGPGAGCDHARLWSVNITGSTTPHTVNTVSGTADLAEPTTVVAFGQHVWVVLANHAGRTVGLRSQDGGRTWRRFDAGICVWDGLVATSGHVVWGTCGTGLLEHFTRQAGTGAPVGIFPGDLGGTSNSALVPLTDAQALAVIEDRHGVHIEATHDGGHQVTRLAPIPRSIARRGFRATFISPRIGYLVTLNGGQLYRTGDAAHHWRRVAPPHP